MTDSSGNLTLEPSNYVLKGNFPDIDDDGDPDGLELAMPQEPDGFYLYLTSPNGGRSTAAAQNTSPIDIDETHAVLNEPWADGHLPTSAARAADIPAPPLPGVTVIPKALTGFEAGVYLVTYAYVGPLGAHTTLAPMISVVVGAGQGINLGLPQQFPENAVLIAIYLSAPNGNASTLRLQGYIDIISQRPSTQFLPGPWSSGRAAAIVNETVEPPPPAPVMQQVQGYTESRPGKYKARVTKVNKRGRETKASPESNEVEITQEAASRKVHAGVTFKDTGRGNNQYNVYITKDGKSHKYVSGTKNSSPKPVRAPKAPTKKRANTTSAKKRR